MHGKTLAFALVASLSILSCSKDETGPPPVTADLLITQGWQAFAGKNYPGAVDKFVAALRLDASKVDAYNGEGWSYARENGLDSSAALFVRGWRRDSTNLQVNAGLAVVYNAQKDYSSSIARGAYVLQVQPQWSFGRDTSVNSFDLNILLAEGYFALADFSSSLARVKVLNPAFNADITQISGQTALANEIERLSHL